MTDGSLAIDTGTPTGSVYRGGVRLNSSGAMYGTETSSVNDIYVSGGIRVSTQGALVYTNDGTTASYQNGNPQASDGTLSVTGAAGVPDSPTIKDITQYLSASASASHNVTMPATIVAGDLLLLLLGYTNDSITSVTGWTQLFEGNSFSTHAAAYYKVAVGGDTATVVLGGAEQLAAQVVRIQKNSYKAASFIESANSDATLDPPNLTPSWGSAKNLWLTIVAARALTCNITAYPLADNQLKITTGSVGGGLASSLGICTVTSTAASLNPSTWAISGGATTSGPVGTIAVRPNA